MASVIRIRREHCNIAWLAMHIPLASGPGWTFRPSYSWGDWTTFSLDRMLTIVTGFAQYFRSHPPTTAPESSIRVMPVMQIATVRETSDRNSGLRITCIRPVQTQHMRRPSWIPVEDPAGYCVSWSPAMTHTLLLAHSPSVVSTWSAGHLTTLPALCCSPLGTRSG